MQKEGKKYSFIINRCQYESKYEFATNINHETSVIRHKEFLETCEEVAG